MMVINKCAFCGKDDLISKFNVTGTDSAGYTLSICGECGVGCIFPLPTIERISREYKTDYYKKDGLALKSILEDDLPFFKLQRKSRVEDIKKGGRILDIGCGGGGFLKSLDKARWEAHGLEISEHAAAIALKDKTLHIKVGGLSDDSYPDAYFDVVTLWHVFEHLYEPDVQLRVIRRILKKGGLLVIAVPNIESLEAGIFKDRWYHLDIPRHIYHYSLKGLEGILHKNGFKTVKTNYFIPKNMYGIIISLMNKSGFDFNLFKRLYLKEKKLFSPRIMAQVLAMAAASPFIITVSAIIFFAEIAAKRPGSFEIFAVKESS